jgi:hypothetical protein
MGHLGGFLSGVNGLLGWPAGPLLRDSLSDGRQANCTIAIPNVKAFFRRATGLRRA